MAKKTTMKKYIKKKVLNFLFSSPEILRLKDVCSSSTVSKKAKLYPQSRLYNSSIGDYTYIAENSTIRETSIGKFCSIGANFTCGWGIHPLKSLSTSPMFYSEQKQNGYSLVASNKIIETKPIKIGNDVFIGMNVTVLDGVEISDGAVIGAGAVVSKNIPPFAIAVGSPIKIIGYRFNESAITKLSEIKWWDWPDTKLKFVEQYFDDIEGFLIKFY